jgi:hypothetical protein
MMDGNDLVIWSISLEETETLHVSVLRTVLTIGLDTVCTLFEELFQQPFLLRMGF